MTYDPAKTLMEAYVNEGKPILEPNSEVCDTLKAHYESYTGCLRLPMTGSLGDVLQRRYQLTTRLGLGGGHCFLVTEIEPRGEGETEYHIRYLCTQAFHEAELAVYEEWEAARESLQDALWERVREEQELEEELDWEEEMIDLYG